MRKNLYTSNDTTALVNANSSYECVNYASWTETEHLRLKSGMVFIANASTFCPEMARVLFDVVLGDYEKHVGVYFPNWEVSYDHAYSKVPKWAKEFF